MHRAFKLAGLTGAALISMLMQASATECIAPADPGGGWDFTCRTIGRLLTEEKLVEGNVQVVNMPGGVGAVAFANVRSKRNSDADLLVATSTVGITQIAQGKYPGDETVMKYVAMLGADVGVLAVAKDSKFKDLKSLVEAMKTDPASVVVGGSTGVGGWDHIRLLLLAQAGGIADLKSVRWVQFDGGSPAVTQMMGGQLDAVVTDLGEIAGFVESKDITLLAAMSEEPVPAFPDVPTAKAQGFDVIGLNWRGVYVGGDVSDEGYNAWVGKLQKLYDSAAWQTAAKNSGLIPMWKGGDEFQAFVREQAQAMKKVSQEIGVIQ